MKKFRISSTFFAMLAVALIAFGCNENENGPTDTINNPTNLMATSGANTGNIGKILLKWTAPSSSATISLSGYELTYSPGGTTPISITANQTSYTVENLAVGTPYTFTLKAKGSNSTVSGGTQIKWAPARFSGVIRLYGSASSQGSGLDFNGGTDGAPAQLKVANGGAWDIGFDDTDPDTLGIGSPYQTSYVTETGAFKAPNNDQMAKKTFVSSARYTGASSLESVFESAALQAGTLEQLQAFTPTATQPFAFIAKTAEGNFAKVLVLATGGQVVHGTGADRYIEVQISYQPTINTPYALPKGVPTDFVVGNTVQRNTARATK